MRSWSRPSPSDSSCRCSRGCCAWPTVVSLRTRCSPRPPRPAPPCCGGPRRTRYYRCWNACPTALFWASRHECGSISGIGSSFVWEDVVDGSEGDHDQGEGGAGGVEPICPVDDQADTP